MAAQTPENGTGDVRFDALLARLAAKAAEKQARKAAEARGTGPGS